MHTHILILCYSWKGLAEHTHSTSSASPIPTMKMPESGMVPHVPFSTRRLICIPKHKHIFKQYEGGWENKKKKCYFNRLLKYLLKLIYMQIKLKTPEGEEICTIFSVPLTHTHTLYFFRSLFVRPFILLHPPLTPVRSHTHTTLVFLDCAAELIPQYLFFLSSLV